MFFYFLKRSWRNILYVVKHIRLCKGLIVSDKKTIPINITAEVIEDDSKDDQISLQYQSLHFESFTFTF
jgi:hypothetical protein